MGFVSGMMGPYMEPIPALGSVAMLISLFAAFVFTPYLAISKWLRPSMGYLRTAEKREHREAEWLEGLFRRILTPLIESRAKQRLFRLAMWAVFIGVCSFFYFKWVAVKMLPLDNKPEFSVVLDMPEGTALPVTANLLHLIAAEVRKMPEVTALQIYAGTARPFDFNGMVRHYYLRSDPWQGELQVQLLHKSERDRTSHELAVEARQRLTSLVQSIEPNAHFAVVEMPPGPPVLQSVVAEVHGPSPGVRRQVARDLTAIFEQAPSTRDVDNYLRDPYEYWRFDVDTEKAVRRGISVDAINRNLSMALGGTSVGDVKQRAGHEPVKIVIQVPLAERSEIVRLGDLPIMAQSGATLPLRELGQFRKVPVEDIIYHKDLRPIEYVVADVGGALAAPVYAMFQVEDLLKEQGYVTPDGVPLQGYWLGPPLDDKVSSFEWTGEWTVTYETFRDMGAAFMVALVLIYILVVWEFGNFRIPLIIMAPIPLTLMGIIPAHFVMFQLGLGGEFTATSMIGWIALAGIIVRNSILLVDFSIHEVQRGIPVAEAVIRACKTRTRPIMITALALVAGSSVIFTDPIFQGMAISLASGVMVSTILTLIVIPLGCINASQSLCEVAAATAPRGQQVPCESEPKPAKRPKAAGRPSWGIALWGKVAGALIMVFYALRGIGLLILQLFKPKKKAASTPGAPKPPPPAPGGGAQGGTGSGGPAPAAGGGAAPSTPSTRAVPGASSARAPVAGSDAVAPRRDAEPGRPAPRATAEGEAPSSGASAQGPSTPAPEARPGAPAKQQQGPRPEAGRPGDRGERPGPARAAGAPSEKAGKGKGSRSRQGRKASGTGTASMVQKKAVRRGIRLKVGDDGPIEGLD
jgi:Cu/Ag efflux pump CusA